MIEEYRPITQEELEITMKQMEEAEKGGMFEGMFSGNIPEYKGPTKKEFMESITPAMKLYKRTFLSIYAKEISDHGFAEMALDKLESVGCSKAREYYNQFVGEYEAKAEKEMKEAAQWYAKHLQEEWQKREREVCNEKKNRRNEVLESWNLQNMSDQEFLIFYQRLKEEKIIENPEQFAILVSLAL